MSVEVEFVRDNAPYAAGDRASFDVSRATAFVEAGAAVRVAASPDPAQQPADPPAGPLDDPLLGKRTGQMKRYHRRA